MVNVHQSSLRKKRKVRLDTQTCRLKFKIKAEYIMKTCPCNIQQLFTALKKDNFQMKNCDVFLIFAQNIDCGYMLEPHEYPQSMF